MKKAIAFYPSAGIDMVEQLLNIGIKVGQRHLDFRVLDTPRPNRRSVRGTVLIRAGCGALLMKIGQQRITGGVRIKHARERHDDVSAARTGNTREQHMAIGT